VNVTAIATFDGRGTSQIGVYLGTGHFGITGLTAEDLDHIAAKLTEQANRQREEDRARAITQGE